MRTGKFLTALAALVVSVSLRSVAGQSASHHALTGRVLLPQGESLSATVLVLSAQPKPDASTPASARSPDLPQRSGADEQGFFKVDSLPSGWLYHLVIIAPGCRPESFERVDPASGPVAARLEALNANDAPPNTVLRGRVLGPRGQPVAGALAQIQGVTRNGWTTWPADNMDRFAESDHDGSFVVYGTVPFTSADGAVEAPGFATGLFEGWAPGDAAHTLTLTEGAALKGRLLQAGNPVANAEIRLGNFGAESGSTAWHYSAFTDHQGRFLFRNLPPNRSCNLYATMESLGDRGALSSQPGHVYDDGSTNDLGDLSLQPAFRLEGRIRLTDGKPVPAQSRLSLVRTGLVGLRDVQSVALQPDGAFSFAGVPAEKVTVYLRIPGYELSPKDRFLKSGSATNFTVIQDRTGLVIPMQPSDE